MPTPSKSKTLPRLPRMERAAEIRALPSNGTDELRRFELSVSSEEPVRRWFGFEILSHDSAAIDLSRMKGGAPVLHQHDGGQQIGVVESARIEDKRLVATVAFSRAGALAQEVATDIEDGIRRNVSVGYAVERAKLVETDDDGADHWLITRWLPMEISVVGVPADASVGFGRAQERGVTFPVEIEHTPLNHGRAPSRGPNTMETRAMNDQQQNQQGPSRSERRAQVQDRGDAAEIARLAGKHGMSHRAEAWIASGRPAAEIAREILESRAAAQQQHAPNGGFHGSGLPGERAANRDLEVPRGYSVRNAILSAIDGENSLEREWSQDYERNSGRAVRANGIFVHPGAVFRRAMDSVTSGAATELVAQQTGELIELLRPVARVVEMGARVMGNLKGPVPFPKHKSGAAATWMPENPSTDVPDSTPQFGTVVLNAKTLMGHSQFSRQLLVQGSLNVEQFVRSDLTSAHGLAIDLAALHGPGNNNQPLGIYKTPDVNTQAMAGNPTFALLVAMATKIASDNAYRGNLGWLTTPGMAGKLMTTLEFASSGSKAIWTGNLLEGQVAGHRAAATNQVSALMSTLEPAGGTEHGIVFGNWQDLMIGLWGALELVVDPYTLARKGLIGVTSFQMADVAARHGESFCVATGATTA